MRRKSVPFAFLVLALFCASARPDFIESDDEECQNLLVDRDTASSDFVSGRYTLKHLSPRERLGILASAIRIGRTVSIWYQGRPPGEAVVTGKVFEMSRTSTDYQDWELTLERDGLEPLFIPTDSISSMRFEDRGRVPVYTHFPYQFWVGTKVTRAMASDPPAKWAKAVDPQARIDDLIEVVADDSTAARRILEDLCMQIGFNGRAKILELVNLGIRGPWIARYYRVHAKSNDQFTNDIAATVRGDRDAGGTRMLKIFAERGWWI